MILKFSFFCTDIPWRKLNAIPVCFGAKDSQFDKFLVEVGDAVKSVKLVHVSGSVSCTNGDSSNWGCLAVDSLSTASTTSNTVILLPESQEQWYKLPGYTPTSKENLFTDLKNPLILSSGQELRIWYGEDLFNRRPHEHYNSGTTCGDVYVNHQ